MGIAGILIGIVGILIGLLNWKLFVIREINKKGTSVVPVVAIIFFTFAGVLSEEALFNNFL